MISRIRVVSAAMLAWARHDFNVSDDVPRSF